ncbi:hypothetical protein F2P45_33645 [Massilia sp. CCM 8733]|uniref:Uncharacterized protein n=1 Tax=Massilia mucilaginosa TaxID=2609282 RepID=A0ABX0P4M2_9BURK|nr:hypothetical protein [Massilia mucilaginosa]NHZ93904.1 hypothetical protein [Massilia mucilaginosa]
MTDTTAQRQARYRANRPMAGTEGNGAHRLDMWIDSRAYYALGRLARRYGVTRRKMIERLVCAEDDRILATLHIDTAELDHYLQSKTLRRNDCPNES